MFKWLWKKNAEQERSTAHKEAVISEPVLEIIKSMETHGRWKIDFEKFLNDRINTHNHHIDYLTAEDQSTGLRFCFTSMNGKFFMSDCSWVTVDEAKALFDRVKIMYIDAYKEWEEDQSAISEARNAAHKLEAKQERDKWEKEYCK
jgi:hypothetical protein